jgi:hypothetical protein
MFNITYLQFHRDFIPLTLWTLKRLPKEYREQICLNVMTSPQNTANYNKFIDKYVGGAFRWRVVEIKYGINYILKVRWACDQDAEYSFKWDEDVFINEHVIKYMMDNTKLLDNPENMLIAPALSNGIPTNDMFADEYLTADERATLHAYYLKTSVPNMWDAGFDKLDDHTIRASKWDSKAFYDEVSKVNHYYRGIHPIRINYAATEYLDSLLLQKTDEYNKPREYDMVANPGPYFCNSLFLIKTKLWKEIANNEGLFRDAFDEVPINLYRHLYDKKMWFVRNAFGVHPIYQSLKNKNTGKLEKEFFDKFRKLVTGLEFDIV